MQNEAHRLRKCFWKTGGAAAPPSSPQRDARLSVFPAEPLGVKYPRILSAPPAPPTGLRLCRTAARATTNWQAPVRRRPGRQPAPPTTFPKKRWPCAAWGLRKAAGQASASAASVRPRSERPCAAAAPHHAKSSYSHEHSPAEAALSTAPEKGREPCHSIRRTLSIHSKRRLHS